MASKTIDATINGWGRFEKWAYFFKGKKYAQFNWDADAFDSGPLPVSDWGFKGDFANGVDAALEGRGAYLGKAYFFKGDKYIRIDWATRKADTDPKPLDAWGLRGPFGQGIDAALNGVGAEEKYAYFFKGDKYVVYSWDASLTAWSIPDGLLPPALRFAWIEYEHPGDGVMLGSGLEALGWKNIFDELGPPGAAKRVVKPALKARIEREKWGSASALICRPTAESASAFLGKWVLNPGVLAGELTYRATSVQADLVCVSGHGGNGEVWGTANNMAGFSVTDLTSANAAMATTGKVKYLIISSCSNLKEEMATEWEPILRKANPIHGILGYESSYAGNELGAKVMRAFVPLLKANKTILQAWKEANLSVAPKQPWAALVHAESEGNTLADWVENRLPVPARGGALKHFGTAHPAGKMVAVVAKAYTVAYKMASGVVIDETNHGSSNAAVGLIIHPGMDLDGLLTFDPALLASPPPSTATVSVTKLSRANPNASNGTKFDGVKIKVLHAIANFELPYTVSAAAHSAYDRSGAGGTYGFFPLGLYPPGTAPNRQRTGEIDYYATGAWLR